MATAMEARSATCGIYVCREAAGFAKEIGEWEQGEVGRGAWIACTSSLLQVALRFAVIQQRLAAVRATQPEVDVGSVTTQVQRIRTALSESIEERSQFGYIFSGNSPFGNSVLWHAISSKTPRCRLSQASL